MLPCRVSIRQSRFVHYILIFFFNDTATTELYTLSLHDALPIWSTPTSGRRICPGRVSMLPSPVNRSEEHTSELQSRVDISYAVFCLKKWQQRSNACEVLRRWLLRAERLGGVGG